MHRISFLLLATYHDDPDISENVQYSLEDTPSPFTLHPSQGAVSHQSDDSQFNLNVI